jgi:hypothetical protein
VLWIQLYPAELPPQLTARSFVRRAFFDTISSPAGADYSRDANLIAETLPTGVRGDFAEERFAAATTAAALARLSAGKPTLDAVASRLAGPRETGQHHCGKPEAEPFEGLPPRY